MAINSYFNSNWNSKEQQDLIESLIIESIQQYGKDLYYIPREFVAFDKLFGEDKISAFNKAYKVEFYVKTYDGYQGQEFLSKFGLDIMHDAVLSVSRKRWEDEVGKPHRSSLSSGAVTGHVPSSISPGQPVDETDVQASEDYLSNPEFFIRPREGDLIYFDFDNSLFEISFVEKREVFFELGNLYTYELRLKKFTLSSEKFNTGVQAIDNVKTYGEVVVLTMQTGGSGSYALAETVTGTAGATGEVILWNSATHELSLITVKGSFVSGDVVTGGTSGAAWTYNGTSRENQGKTTHQIIDNDEIAIESSTVINSTENDPLR